MLFLFTYQVLHPYYSSCHPLSRVLFISPTGWVSASGPKASLVPESPACHGLLLVLLGNSQGAPKHQNKNDTTPSTCHACSEQG